MKKIIYPAIIVIIMFALVSCSTKSFSPDGAYSYESESYLDIEEDGFVNVSDKPDSYFSLDNSTASYANLRRMINEDVLIPKNAVKIEELVNYFSYEYESPTDVGLKISGEITSTPWNSSTKIVAIGVKAKDIDLENKKPSNIVLLLDVSGSMSSANKLPLLQSAFKLFVEQLDKNDTISIVTYANGQHVLLNGAKGYEKNRIMGIIEDLEAGGSTAGAQGIQTAYDIAKENFIPNGHNRVIIGTDGDFNVGISSLSLLKAFISEKRDEEKIYLSVLGFGYGNLKDDKLETLANAGNGTYAYIDTITEARKVLVEEMGGNLNIVSKDTKIKVTFNPKYVAKYRLLGYENQRLSEDEYDNPNTDAGEIGAGHLATAVYEIVLNEDNLVESTMDSYWLNVEISYKDPETDESKKIVQNIDQNSKLSKNSDDIIFIQSVIEFGLILRDSQFKADSSLDNIINRLTYFEDLKTDDYKQEFINLVIKYKNSLG